MKVNLQEDPRLPGLGWIARVNRSWEQLSVVHGSNVERGDRWVVEGVWDGPFDGRFAESEHFFGSGVYATNGSVTFVPSSALVDRLLWADLDGALVVSNSLVLLLAATGRRLVPGVRGAGGLYAIMRGIDSYDDRIPTTSAAIHQLYYHNLTVSRGGRTIRYKAEPRDISSFEQYTRLITEAVQRLGDNLSDSHRRRRVRPLATISRGYDSPAVCALGRAARLTTCYTSPRSNSLIPAMFSRAATDDDGTAIALALGLEPLRMGACDTDELYFLAGSDEPELAFGTLARDIFDEGSPAAVFTGYHGDMIWRVDAFEDDRAPAMIRHDVSGLNLCEIRLKAGFFNVPLTFLYARSQASITRLSRSEVMFPWRTWSGYDRPIPRRLLTEAGVDGSLFGQRKKAIVQRPDLPTTAHYRGEFLDAIKEQTGYGHSTVMASRLLNTAMSLPLNGARRLGFRNKPLIRPSDIRSRLYVWAVNRLASYYEGGARFDTEGF